MSDDMKNAADAANNAPDGENNAADAANQESKKSYSEEAYNAVKNSDITRGKKIKELEEKIKKFEDEKLTESEKDKKKIAELEAEKDSILAERKAEKIDNLILKKSSGKKIVDIEALMMFAKKELANIEQIDESAVGSAIDKVLKEKPYLLSSENVIPSDGNFAKNDKAAAKDGKSILNSWMQKVYRG